MAGDQLSALFVNQVQNVVQRLQTQMEQTSANGAEGASQARATVSADEVVGLLEGDSAWMSGLEQQLEQDFKRIADKALSYWMDTTARTIRNSIREVSGLLDDLLGAALDGSLSGSLGDASSPLRGKVNSVLGAVAGAALQQVLVKTQTTVAETDRSRDEASRFKSSRGQQQSEVSRALANGTRFT